MANNGAAGRVPKQRNPPVAAAAQARPVPAPREPLTEEQIAQALKDLGSGDAAAETAALERLATCLSGQDRQNVARAIVPHLDRANAAKRKLAFRALANWATADDLPRLVEGLQEPDKAVRAAAMKALGELRDARAIQPLVDRLLVAVDRGPAVAALKEIGADCEQAVLPFLNHEEMWVRSAAVDILSEVGGAEALQAMEQLRENDEEKFIREKVAGVLRKRAPDEDR